MSKKIFALFSVIFILYVVYTEVKMADIEQKNIKISAKYKYAVEIMHLVYVYHTDDVWRDIEKTESYDNYYKACEGDLTDLQTILLSDEIDYVLSHY